MNKQAEHITQTGITDLSIKGNKIRLTHAGVEVKILLAGEATKMWVGGVLRLGAGSTEVQVKVAPVKYTDEHFAEVRQIMIERNHNQDEAIRQVADKYDFKFELFRRQYFARDGNIVPPRKSE